MNRSKTDAVIGIVGAIAITFTLVGVFVYDHNPSDQITTDTGAIFSVSGEEYGESLSNGGVFENVFQPGPSVTGMTVIIDWTPSAPGTVEPLAECTYELLREDGTVANTGPCTSGAVFAVTHPRTEVYTIHIGAPNQSLGGDFTVEATYDY